MSEPDVLADLPNCDRDKLVCPLARWADRARDEIVALREGRPEIAAMIRRKARAEALEEAARAVSAMRAEVPADIGMPDDGLVPLCDCVAAIRALKDQPG